MDNQNPSAEKYNTLVHSIEFQSMRSAFKVRWECEKANRRQALSEEIARVYSSYYDSMASTARAMILEHIASQVKAKFPVVVEVQGTHKMTIREINDDIPSPGESVADSYYEWRIREAMSGTVVADEYSTPDHLAGFKKMFEDSVASAEKQGWKFSFPEETK